MEGNVFLHAPHDPRLTDYQLKKLSWNHTKCFLDAKNPDPREYSTSIIDKAYSHVLMYSCTHYLDMATVSDRPQMTIFASLLLFIASAFLVLPIASTLLPVAISLLLVASTPPLVAPIHGLYH